MIHNHSRAWWIGASDTRYVMGSWDTSSFQKWFAVKLGYGENNYQNKQMSAGTAYEHRILSYIGVKKWDRQIRKRRLRLRVNLDGEDRTTVYEVKTYGTDTFKLSTAYWQQCQVERYTTGKNVIVVAYRMTDAEYDNYFLPVDGARIQEFPVEYDEAFIYQKYLPRLSVLAQCLKERRFPNESEIARFSIRRSRKADSFHDA